MHTSTTPTSKEEMSPVLSNFLFEFVRLFWTGGSLFWERDIFLFLRMRIWMVLGKLLLLLLVVVVVVVVVMMVVFVNFLFEFVRLFWMGGSLFWERDIFLFLQMKIDGVR